MDIEFVVLVLCPIGFLIPGILFLRWGLKGKRVGDDPHCRKCRYNLTGLTSDVCPECGSDLSRPKARTIGIPRRRWLFLLVAVFVFACCGVVGYHGVERFVRWKNMPDSVVWFFSKHHAHFAQVELASRLQLHSLSPDRVQAIIEYSLEQQAKGGAERFWLVWLREARVNHLFSPEQEEQYFRHSHEIELHIRDRVRVGDPLPVWVQTEPNHFELYGPERLNRNWIKKGSVAIDGEEVATFALDDRRWADRLSGYHQNLETQDLSPGPHSIDVVMDIEFWEPTDYLYAETRITHSDQFSLLAADMPDPVTWLDDPELTDALQKYLEPNRIYFREDLAGMAGEQGGLLFEYEDKLPVMLFDKTYSFEILLLYDDQTVIQSMWAFSKDYEYHAKALLLSVDSVPPEGTVDVVFRGNKDEARKTYDCYQSWKGEIRFDDVPLIHVKLPATQPAEGDD